MKDEKRREKRKEKKNGRRRKNYFQKKKIKKPNKTKERNETWEMEGEKNRDDFLVTFGRNSVARCPLTEKNNNGRCLLTKQMAPLLMVTNAGS